MASGSREKAWRYGDGWKTREEVWRGELSAKVREDYSRELNQAHQLRELRILQERTNRDGRLTEQDRGALRNEIDRT